MFGDDVRDAITSNILMEASYPHVLTFFMCMFVAIIPLTKIPLNALPINAIMLSKAGNKIEMSKKTNTVITLTTIFIMLRKAITAGSSECRWIPSNTSA